MSSGSTRVERSCEFCGAQMSLTPSQLRRAKGRFCSMACKVASLAAARQRTCPQCGRTRQYRPGQRIGIYCSRDCQALAQRKQEPSTCAHCSAPIRDDPSARRRFCSQACYHASRARRLAPRVTLTCAYCAQTFDSIASQAAGGRRFCSVECYRASSGTTIVSCGVCGRERRVWASQFSHGGGKYCSHQCQGEANRRQRQSVQCERCGESFEQRRTWRTERFCSRRCFEQRGLATRTEKRCEQCRRRFNVPASLSTRRFCSPTCYRQSIARRKYRCTTCGSENRTYPSRMRHGRHYCSLSCANRGRSRRPNQALLARNARILTLKTEGLTAPQILRALGVEQAEWGYYGAATIRQVISRANGRKTKGTASEMSHFDSGT